MMRALWCELVFSAKLTLAVVVALIVLGLAVGSFHG
jgi:hypothetical protein